MSALRRSKTTATGSGSVSIAGNATGSISTSTVGTQVLGAGTIPLTLAIKDSAAIFTAAGTASFAGREWLTREIDTFLETQDRGEIKIEAEAGPRKTAFAAWLVKTRGYLNHFSRYTDGQATRTALG